MAILHRDGRRPRRAAAAHGFTLVELLVACAVMSLVMGGVIGFFGSVSRVTREQQEASALEGSLRLALERSASDLRRARYSAPQRQLPTWITWVAGFDANPQLRRGSDGAPDALSVAACTAAPIATLRASAAASADGSLNTLDLRSAVRGKAIAELLNSTSKRLIRVGDGGAADEGFALVTAVNGAVITIDTDPGTAGSQGFRYRAWFTGTPVCRVDVTTYSVDPTTRTLRIDEHQGAGAQPAVDGVTDLRIAVSGDEYRLRYTVQAERSALTREFATTVRLRNH